MKRYRALWIHLLLSFYCCGLLYADEPASRPTVDVVYPREGSVLPPVDSQFVIGQALGATALEINGRETKLYDSGAFLGWIPVSGGEFTIEVKARNVRGTTTYLRKVEVLSPAASTPRDSLRIEADYSQPNLDTWLWSGDLLEVYCRTTPRSELLFSIPGVAVDIPMTELPPQRQLIFRGNAFRNKDIPDSLDLRGVYYGSYRVAIGERADSVRVVFTARHRIPLYDRDSNNGLYASDSIRYSLDSSFADLFTTDSTEGRVTILDDRFPYVARIKDSVIVTRVGPGLGYLWPFMPEGTTFEVTGRKGDWIRMRLAAGQDVWAHDTSLVMLPPGLPVPQGTVNYTRVDGLSDRTEVRLFFSNQLPYRISETLDPLTLTVTVFGATSDIDWIRYDFDDVLVEYADWRQPAPGVLEYTLHLNADQLWGYDSWYEEGTLVVSIKKPPTTGMQLRGFTIVVDPGHSSDDGAVGPTRMKEKDANLLISKKLRQSLQRRGAEVVLTRGGSEHLPLYDRPIIAKAENADLFISIHNNALPDGVNPWESHGVSTYYYHPFSKDLSEYVQASMLNNLDMKNFGHFRANFAVIRPTQYPAILVECAFMMIPEHEAALKTGAFQSQVAEAIAQGVERWVKHALPDKRYNEARRELHRRDGSPER